MIKDILVKAFELKRKGYYKHAIETLYKALEYDNSSIELLYEIAGLYYLIKNEERALNYIEQIFDIAPSHINSLKLLMRIFANKQAYDKAEQAARNIYQITSEANDLAQILYFLNLQKKFSDVTDFPTEKNNPSIAFEKALAYFQIQNYNKAICILKNSFTEFGKNKQGLLLLGQIYSHIGDIEHCIEISTEFNPEEQDADICEFLSKTEYYKKEYKNAIYFIKKAIQINPKRAEYYFHLAEIYAAQTEYNFAKNAYNIAISLSPNTHKYHLALATLYYNKKYYKRALEELTDDTIESKILKMKILFDMNYLVLSKKVVDELLLSETTNETIQEYKVKIKQALEFK